MSSSISILGQNDSYSGVPIFSPEESGCQFRINTSRLLQIGEMSSACHNWMHAAKWSHETVQQCGLTKMSDVSYQMLSQSGAQTIFKVCQCLLLTWEIKACGIVVLIASGCVLSCPPLNCLLWLHNRSICQCIPINGWQVKNIYDTSP